MPKELVATSPGQVELIDYEDIAPDKGQIHVKTEYSACKHGTEMWILQGKAHWMTHERDREMRIFTEKRTSSMFPTPLGDVAVGIIENVGEDVTDFYIGDRVYFYAGARDSHTIPVKMVSKLPQEMSWQDAFCHDPAGFALGALRDSNLRLGDKVGIFGLGAIGLIALQMAKLQGASIVVAVDPIESRRNLALELGVDLVFDPSNSDTGLEIRKKVGKNGLDVTIDFSGVTKGLHDCIRSTTYGGKVIAGSMYKSATQDLKLGMEFHWNNITIVSSRACNEPNPDHPRWNWDRVIHASQELLREKKLKTIPIIHPLVPFEDALEHYLRIEQNPDHYIKLAFQHD